MSAATCINKNTPEYKALLSQVGSERLAVLAILNNGYEVPDVRPITEIKNAIKFKSEVENFAGIAANLRRYNTKNNTSHYFTFTKAFGNTFKLELKYNYLPVDLERQRQRKARQGDPMYMVVGFNQQGFNQVYPNNNRQSNLFEGAITGKETPTTSTPTIEEERDLGFYNGDAALLEQESRDMDFLIEGSGKKVVDLEKRRERKINDEIIKQRQLLKNVTDADALRSIINRIEGLRKQLDQAEGRVVVAQNINAFEDVLQFGNSQVNEIQKLLSNPAVSYEDVYYAQKVLNLWLKAGDFSTPSEEHIFLDEYEFNTPEIRSAFREIASKASDLQSHLTTLKTNYVSNFVRQYTDGKLSKEEIFKHLKQVGKIGTTTLNLSRHDDAMLQSIFSAVEQANMNAKLEAGEVWEKLDVLSKAFLKKSGGNFNILKQVDENGLETGRAVSRFATSFYDTRNQLMKNAFWSRDAVTGKLKKNDAGVKAYYDWINKNTASFDPRILFPDSNLEDGAIPESALYKRVKFDEGSRQKHIAELKSHLGEKGYEYYIKRVEAKIEKFKIRREVAYSSIQLEEGLSQQEKDSLFDTWQKEHSPYWGMDMAENPVSRRKGKDSFYSPKGIREYVEQVPKKTVDGVTTKWYDQNFAKIEADEDLLAYHSFMMETLNTLRYTLPQQKQALLGVGVLPTIQKSLMDIFQEKGVMMGIVPFWDKMKQLQTTTDFATTVHSDVDSLTGDIEKNIQLQFIEDTSAKVREIVKEKTIAHKQATGKPATTAEINQFTAEARDFLSKNKSWDITKILKAYSLTVLAHKHKSFIEPQIRLAEQAFKSRKQLVTNKAGEVQKDVQGNVLVQEGNDNLKSALEFFLDSEYWGVGGRKVEGVTKTKLYTKEETAHKKELEALLAEATTDEDKQFLQDRIDSLGGFRTMSGVGDTALKYMTLKGLGWNFFSAFSNIGFGAISNIIQASDGREYSAKHLRDAYLLVTNSIGRNASFNTWEGVNGNALKIRKLMDKWDLLQTSNKEMFDTSNKSSMSKLNRFGPFTLQERSEYLNIAPVMVAIMMEFPATNPDGEATTMWEAYDMSTGSLKEGYTTTTDEVKMFQKIKRVVEMNHGDYNNALQVKATIGGRALSQFRTWMFEGFANRFEAEKVDYALSYGLDEAYVRKGRYKSYTKGQLNVTGAAIGTMILPGIGTAVGAGAGYLAGKFFGMQTEESAMGDTLYTLKHLARKLMFSKSRSTDFNEKFSKVDAANMRKNMTELYIILGLMGLALMLKALAGGDDEEEDASFATNFLLNQTIRLRTDIGFYTNPLEFEKLTKTAVPMAQLVSDVTQVMSDIGAHLNDKKDDEVFNSGSFKGVPKWLIHTGQLLPGPAQGIRLYKTGDKVID
jgi:hypothetical protein